MSSAKGNPSSDTNLASTTDQSSATEPASRLRDRPLAVYGVLGLGVATLLILLGIIYFSSSDRDEPDQPICTAITAGDAMRRIYAGEVERLTVNYDDTGDPQTSERFGPVLARIDFIDGQCANLPEGIMGSTEIYQVLGVIEFYNDTTENPRVEVRKERSESLQDSLYQTPTPEPTETPIPTETTVVTETAVPTVEPTIEPTATIERAASPEAEGTPVVEASPAA